MHRFRFSHNTVLVAMLVACTGLTSTARAQDAGQQLVRAIQLFEEGNYLAAQEAFVGVDRDQLDDGQRARRDDYLSRTQIAITMSEKALRDLEDAETALSANETARARELLDGVLANEYAAPALVQSAQASLRDLDSDSNDAAPPATGGREIAPEDAQGAGITVRQGEEMLRAGRYDEARRLFNEALRLVPGFPDAVDGLARLDDHERNVAGPRADSLIERIRRQNQISWQRAVTEFRSVDQSTRAHVDAERFADANREVVRGRQIVEAAKQFADPGTKYESLRDEADSLAQHVRTQERTYNERTVAEHRRDVESQREQHLREIEQRRTEQVDVLLRQAEQHRKDGDLDAAINVLKQVVVIDPRHRAARWRMDDLEDLRQYKRGREMREDFYKESRKALNDVEESKIPWYEPLIFPSDWPELITRPTRQQLGSSSRRNVLFGALDKRIQVDFTKDPFDQVIERLADAQNLNIIVNWNDLQRVGVMRNVPIDLDLPREITLKKALTEVLDQAGAGIVDLGFDVGDGVIKIATRETLNKQTFTQTYDINDLLMKIPMFNDAPMTDLTKLTRRGRRMNRAQQAELPWRYGDDDDDEPEEDPARASRVQKLINLIMDNVATDTWIQRGGTTGTINEFNSQLVVTQNSLAQSQLGNLLGKLRAQRAIQIAVESRFITVSSHYLEELGVDIDIVLNGGNAGFDYVPTGQGALVDAVLGNALLLPRSLSRLGFTPASPALGTALLPNPNTGVAQPFGQTQFIPQASSGSGSSGTPVPILNQVTSFTSASNLGSDIPGSFAGTTLGPAFSLFGSFLDNIQVDFLIRATQADSRTTVLTAPRLVLFNGQRSWVAVTIQQNYVSQLTPVVATGAVAQAPQTDTIDSGAVMDVTATVNADRRYVTMTLRPGVTRLLDMQTIPFSGGGAGGGFGGGAALAAFIQLPTLSSQRIQTTVSVPDGGTLLIGGQKLASEGEIEAGVPILSKIPILKRLYSSRSMIKDEQTLLILVKPRILIQPEQEQLAFPTFNEG